MARSVLDIVIKLSKQGGADRETVKALVQVKSGLAQLGMAAGVVTGALYTAKKAMDFAKEGASLQFVEQRFDRLSNSIGANSSLLGDLRDVTRGLYSDTQLMSGAADLMGLGLVKNSDELERMMRVSSGLNQNMNQLVLTLTNMTTMRFDALNMSVDGFKERVKALEDAGMSANDAFKEAFLQQGEAQLVKQGEAADSTAGSFMRLEAELKNIGDTGKKAFAEGIEPLVRGLADLLGSEAKATEQAKQHAIYIEVAKNMLRAQTGEVNISTARASALASQLEAAAAAEREWSGELQQATSATQDANAASESYSMTLDAVQAAVSGPIANAQESYHESLNEIRDDLVELQAEQDKTRVGSEKYNEIAGQIGEKQQAIEDVTAAYREQANQIMFNIGQEQILASSLAPEQQVEAIAALGMAMGRFDQQTADAYTTTAAWTKQLEQGEINTTQFAQLMGLMSDSVYDAGVSMEEAAAGGANELTGQVRDLTVQTISAKQEVNLTIEQLEKLDGMSATATVNILVNGSVPSLSGGGWNSPSHQMGSGGGLGSWSEFFAEGGTLGDNLAVVGENGWETIVKDKNGRYTVIPHETSKVLAGLGLLAGAQGLVEGGPLPGTFIHPVTGNVLNVTGSSKHNRRNGGGGSTTTTTVSGDLYGSSTQTVTETVTPLVQVTEQAVASVQASQTQQMVEGRLTRAQQAVQNAEMMGLLRENNRLLQRFMGRLTTDIKSAVAQGNP